MNTFIESLSYAFSYYPTFAIVYTIPILLLSFLKYKHINILRISASYIFLFYIVCLFSLVFLPLPDAGRLLNLSTYDAQLVPFHFIVDIVNDNPFDISNPDTYADGMLHKSIWQVIFNIIMTIPFGLYISYFYGLSKANVVRLTFTLSLFIEVAQLTGLFFLFNGSYRYCDVDDLLANTLGGLIGYMLAKRILHHRRQTLLHFRLPA